MHLHTKTSGNETSSELLSSEAVDSFSSARNDFILLSTYFEVFLFVSFGLVYASLQRTHILTVAFLILSIFLAVQRETENQRYRTIKPSKT